MFFAVARLRLTGSQKSEISGDGVVISVTFVPTPLILERLTLAVVGVREATRRTPTRRIFRVYDTVESEYSDYEFVHTTIITLINADGYVERTHRLGQDGIDQLRLINDFRTVRNGGGIV